jgi:hypothetical protein
LEAGGCGARARGRIMLYVKIKANDDDARN